MRRALTTLLLASVLVGGIPPAFADPTVEEYQRKSIVVEDQEEQSATLVTRARRSRWVRSVPRPARRVYWELQWLEGDVFCLRRSSTTNPAVARGAADGVWSLAFARANDGVRAECPAAPPADRPPERVADDVARQFWDVRVLPEPGLRVVPDYAVTGKPVYLEIVGPKQQHFDVDNPLGQDVVITASSRYLIDWGDGSTDETASQGGSWPHGDVTHAYTKVASGVTITVTQLWSARWSTGNAAGELTDLRTTSSIVLPVTQLQAVRNF